MYKRLLSGLLCVICICSLCACGSQTEDVSVSSEPVTEDVSITSEPITEDVTEDSSVVQIVNPWTDCATIEEAEGAAGFNFDSVKSAEVNSVSVMKGEEYNIIQISFYDGDNKVTIRKANTVEGISGDYNAYTQKTPIIKDEVTVTLRGNDDLYSFAEWDRNGYFYSISCEQVVELEIIESYINVVFE